MLTLNSQQTIAVTSPLQPTVVFAGPGTGKTRVLTERIVALMDDPFALPPQSILAMTFTNKAANEMRERLIVSVGQTKADKVPISTIHAWCLAIVKQYHWAIDLSPDFTIADDATKLQLLSYCVNTTDHKSLEYIADIISRVRFDMETNSIEADMSTVGTWIQRYEDQLERSNMIDFDQILLRTQEILSIETLADDIARKYACILIDEFQDTDSVQYTIIARLARDHRHIFVVCDDDQSIYMFRGASVENITRFRRDFQPRIITLSENYRSSAEIIQVTKETIASIQTHDKHLTAQFSTGQFPVLCVHDTPDQQKDAFVGDLQQALETRAPEDIAILCPSNYLVSFVSDWLAYAGIHHYTSSGESIAQYPQIQTILAYLKVAYASLLDQDTPESMMALSFLCEREHIIPPSCELAIKSFVDADIPLYTVIQDVLQRNVDLGLSSQEYDQLDGAFHTLNNTILAVQEYVHEPDVTFAQVLQHIQLQSHAGIDIHFTPKINSESFENAGLLEYMLSGIPTQLNVTCHATVQESIIGMLRNVTDVPITIHTHQMTEIRVVCDDTTIICTDIYSLTVSIIHVLQTRVLSPLTVQTLLKQCVQAMFVLCVQQQQYCASVFEDYERCRFLYLGLQSIQQDVPGDVAENMRTFLHFMPVEQKIKDYSAEFALMTLTKRLASSQTPLMQAIRQAIDRISLSTEYALLHREGVHVLTIHAAKGMEFEQVFVLGCEEGSIPSYRAVKREQAGDVRFLREQQRVLYVAMTRAKKVLRLYAVRKVGKYQKSLSRFIPESVIERSYRLDMQKPCTCGHDRYAHDDFGSTGQCLECNCKVYKEKQ